MRTLILTIAILASSAGTTFASDWSAIAPLSEARFGAAGAAIGEDFYVLGGSEVFELSSVSVWDAASGSWNAVAPMSAARQFPGAAVSGGRLYAIGGYGPGGIAVSSAERFDPAAGAWSAIAPLPGVRALAGVVALNGAVYVMTGEGASGVPQEDCYRYDPGANAWTLLTPVPTPRSGVAAAVLNGEIWVMGGASGSSLARTEIFNPADGSWRIGPDMPEALWMPSAASFDGRIWVMGGFDAFFDRSDRVYSVGTDGAWRSESALPVGVAGAASASNGARLVVAGGMDATGSPVASAATRVGELPPPPPPPPPAEDDTLFCSVEIMPRTLNLKSNGHWVTADISALNGDVATIDVATLTLGGVAADAGAEPEASGGVLTVRFPRDGFSELEDGDQVLALAGLTNGGDVVAGEGHVRISGSGKKKAAGNRGPAFRPGRGNNPMHAMAFTLESPMHVEMTVHDVQGRNLGTVASGPFGAGTHTIEWGRAGTLGPGVYFIRARFDDAIQTTRFAVIR